MPKAAGNISAAFSFALSDLADGEGKWPTWMT